MADITDVCSALVAFASQALYPAGTSNPSVAGVPIKVYQGWPITQQLDADLNAASPVCHVSVFPRREEANTTRFPRDWQTISQNTPTLAATVAGQVVTIAGTVPDVSNPTNVSVEANGQAFVYAVQPTDTLTGIATALTSLIASGVAGTSNNGAAITLPSSARNITARVGVTGVMVREVRRQNRHVQITVWADTPAHRSAIAAPLDVVLADMQWITLPDGLQARLLYKGSPVEDGDQKERLYRRDLIYSVDFATSETTTATQVTQTALGVAVANAPTINIIS